MFKASIKSDLKKLANPKKAKILAGFFKTGKGEYGEGDVFWGLTSAQIKAVAKKYHSLGLEELRKLLQSKIHEERVATLRILNAKYQEASKKSNNRTIRRSGKKSSQQEENNIKKELVRFYLDNAQSINNWDLVDVSAPQILGNWLLTKNRQVLYRLAKSKNLWERRIAIVATYAFIRNNELKDTIKIAQLLLGDKHDLIHKAAGWMLREVGHRDQKILKLFLNKHAPRMPRTMLRYAIEKLPERERKRYLKK